MKILACVWLTISGVLIILAPFSSDDNLRARWVGLLVGAAIVTPMAGRILGWW